jgi:hypothetical protein
VVPLIRPRIQLYLLSPYYILYGLLFHVNWNIVPFDMEQQSS